MPLHPTDSPVCKGGQALRNRWAGGWGGGKMGGGGGGCLFLALESAKRVQNRHAPVQLATGHVVVQHLHSPPVDLLTVAPRLVEQTQAPRFPDNLRRRGCLEAGDNLQLICNCVAVFFVGTDSMLQAAGIKLFSRAPVLAMQISIPTTATTRRWSVTDATLHCRLRHGAQAGRCRPTGSRK